jgi:hypothetical protein
MFHISLNQAEIIITLLIHFFQASTKDSKTKLAGIAKTTASTIIGKSFINL